MVKLSAGAKAILRRVRRVKRQVEQKLSAPKKARELSKAEAAVAAFPSVMVKVPHRLSGGLIISLTSYPGRYGTLHKTLRSLLDQSVETDGVVLWLEDGDEATLPQEVLDLRQYGLTLRSCDDFRSAGKLVPSLVAYPEAYIVTADDDLYYNPDWLSTLIEVSWREPRAIVGHRAHLAKFDKEGRPWPYTRWRYNTKAQDAPKLATALFLTGVGGILYPPQSLHPAVLDNDLRKRLCPRADDIWFFAMSQLAGTRRIRTAVRFAELEWEASQSVTLKTFNVAQGGNDAQMRAVFEHFPELYAINAPIQWFPPTS